MDTPSSCKARWIFYVSLRPTFYINFFFLLVQISCPCTFYKLCRGPLMQYGQALFVKHWQAAKRTCIDSFPALFFEQDKRLSWRKQTPLWEILILKIDSRKKNNQIWRMFCNKIVHDNELNMLAMTSLHYTQQQL